MTRRYEELSSATWGAARLRIVSRIRETGQALDAAVEEDRLRIQIRMLLAIDEDEAGRLAEEFGARVVVEAAQIGWTPSDGVPPRLFVLANPVSW